MAENNAKTNGLFNRTKQTYTTINNNYNDKKALISSLMPKFIEILYKNVIYHNTENNLGDTVALDEYDVGDKIEYNNLQKYRDIAEDYGTYYTCCKDSLNILDDAFLNSKQRILFSINEYYKEEKRLLLSTSIVRSPDLYEIIKSNSDQIIDNIKDKLEKEIEKDYNGENICSEDIKYCLPIFLCFAFMECKILEKRPNK